MARVCALETTYYTCIPPGLVVCASLFWSPLLKKRTSNNNLFPPWTLFPGGCFNNHGLNHRRSLGRSSLRSYPRRGGGGVSVLPVAHAGKLRPKGVPFSSFWYAVYDGLGISLVKVRVENLSLRSLLKELKRANRHSMAVEKTRKLPDLEIYI